MDKHANLNNFLRNAAHNPKRKLNLGDGSVHDFHHRPEGKELYKTLLELISASFDLDKKQKFLDKPTYASKNHAGRLIFEKFGNYPFHRFLCANDAALLLEASRCTGFPEKVTRDVLAGILSGELDGLAELLDEQKRRYIAQKPRFVPKFGIRITEKGKNILPTIRRSGIDKIGKDISIIEITDLRPEHHQVVITENGKQRVIELNGDATLKIIAITDCPTL